MPEKKLKIIFIILAVILLVSMIRISRDAGISGDEEVHYQHSEMVYKYFSSLGKDQQSLDTPKTHLQYYGQAFDNLVTILIHWFDIEDIYSFRHLMCSIAGWLIILITALFAASFSGYGASILVLLLFAVSPNFLGHTQNNLKDIPFALAYISSIYYSTKLVFSEEKPSRKTISLLILSIAFAIGIRAGGLLVIFYLGFFMLLKVLLDWHSGKNLNLKQQSFLFLGISVAGYLLGLVLWPYALQNPLINPWKSYRVMTQFPTTIMQIFEGHMDWSDVHPWYYLPKYMLITIPLIVFTGIAAFLFKVKSYSRNQKTRLILLAFTILFPILFVILKKSNLYGSWRHFLFVYPGIVLFSALGFYAILDRYRHRLVRIATITVLFILMLHPIRFMAANHPYYYLYYNQTIGGLKGAYTNYETDYYYHTMRKGAEWLQEYLKNKPDTGQIVVGVNFPCQWYFRNSKNIRTTYFPYQNRSQYNWDYLIVANSYIPPYQLKNKIWPPANTIHTIFADGIPVCAVVERITKDDLGAIQAMTKGDNIKSALLFQNALRNDPQNELIYYKFASFLVHSGQDEQAEKVLQQSLKINPDEEQSLTLLGDLSWKQKKASEAIGYYEGAIRANKNFFCVYPKIASVYAETDVLKARLVLKKCLNLNSKYVPALEALAETYRKTNPEIAGKYDKMIEKLKQ